MAALEELGLLPFIRKRIEEGSTYKVLCNELRSMFPGVRGVSVRSIKRFCAVHGLRSTSRLSNRALDVLVAFGVGTVGPTYGRKMMTGFLASQGFKVSQKRVGRSLKRVDPLHHVWRQNTTRRLLNPVPYRAAYFGEKLHIDQNEKIIMYGVTHVCAVDGFSGKIVGFISMPVKSNSVIYDKLYRDIVATYGLWDQVRVDKGREWYLSLFVNDALSPHRYCTSKPPHLQTSSKQNHTIERLWVEVNKRVNYPLKKVLNDMVQDGDLSLEDPSHQFCCSWLTLHVSSVGAQLFVASWNAHPIPGGRKRYMKRGVPNMLMNRDNRAKRIDLCLLPSVEEAVSHYTSAGGCLAGPCQFGTDPLELCPTKKDIRLQSFCSKFNFKALFCDVSNGCGSSFSSAFKYFVDVTYRLSHSS